MSCVFETVQGDLIFFTAGGSTLEGGSGSSMFVETPDFELVLDGQGGTADFADTTLTASVPLVDVASQQPAGSATVVADRIRLGQPTTEEIRERSGNSWTTGTLTTTDYRLHVTSVIVPGYDVLLDGNDCTGQDLAFDVKTTNPTAQIYSSVDFGSDICDLDGLPDGQVRLTGQPKRPFFEVVIDDGSTPLKASGDLELKGRSGSATAELIDLTTEQPVAELSITVELEKIGRAERDAQTDGRVTERMTRVPYRATITVSTSDRRSGRADCFAEESQTKIIVRPESVAGRP
ncbi:hypothetical protein [Microlunatus sp. Gsoil 973]|uniref:hypothetical protein n=1 Tax=Microlunatus sp. Gsoil 973 TaxID=2672569 RepID=UPI0012B45C02|nr:hypothetical protein [Microlunatus sp. Gsoil 973]QGN34904.1 hypothetical protein GJV80_21120 [Microlunatus sp. Gsoil 973]